MSIMPGKISAPSEQYITEVTVQNFMHEVVQTSLQIPVLVYFTATWCQPCKQFGPLLEKIVTEADGRLRLAKVDIDKNQQLAQQFRIQSVPMVYIFVGGQPADGFSGAMPESQLKQLLSQFMSATPEQEDAKAILSGAAELLNNGNAEQAARIYSAVLETDKENVEALTGLASAYIAMEQLPKAEAVLAMIPESSANHKAVVAVKAKLLLLKSAPDAKLVNKLTEAVAKNPNDHQSRFELASALIASGKPETAIDELLHIIAANKDWNEGEARKKLLTVFESLGFKHPLAVQGRRKLSAILFK